MKALTLTQPWASLVIAGTKRWETRGWATHYRGPLVIHAAKAQDEDAAAFAFYLVGRGLLGHAYQPRGVVLGTVQLLSVHRAEQMHPSPQERELGDYTPGRWVWVLSDPVRFPEPIPARGALGLWDWERAA